MSPGTGVPHARFGPGRSGNGEVVPNLSVLLIIVLYFCTPHGQWYLLASVLSDIDKDMLSSFFLYFWPVYRTKSREGEKPGASFFPNRQNPQLPEKILSHARWVVNEFGSKIPR